MDVSNYEQVLKLFVLWNENKIPDWTFAKEVVELIESDYNLASEIVYDEDDTTLDALMANPQYKITKEVKRHE